MALHGLVPVGGRVEAGLPAAAGLGDVVGELVALGLELPDARVGAAHQLGESLVEAAARLAFEVHMRTGHGVVVDRRHRLKLRDRLLDRGQRGAGRDERERERLGARTRIRQHVPGTRHAPTSRRHPIPPASRLNPTSPRR